ncbi:hypothetical protein AB0F81_09895 [Actinoplanes sp. NPDC024001]|uniref:hypothetical protein n=1 Tax=Actinoplanes sp. NPDC024001 TaxID=3154598 RepID=UPI003403C381
MVCASCGLDNDPSATLCARCNATLGVRPAPPVPEAPAYPPPGAPARRRWPSPLPMVAAAVVLVVLVVVIGVVVAGRSGEPGEPAAVPVPVETTTEPPATQPTTIEPTTPPTTEPTASPQEQAEAIDALLDRSVASRRKLNNAIDRVRRCADLDGALADMREVGVERGEQISEINAADLSALDEGETLRGALSTALGHSLDADEHFVAWAQPAVTGGCGGSAARAAAWERGQASSRQAQAAKKQFLAVWNRVAAPFGLATRSNQDI